MRGAPGARQQHVRNSGIFGSPAANSGRRIARHRPGDGQERRLAHVRDRVGIKPLYYGWMAEGGSSGDAFLFGSELKALRAHPAFRGEIDRDALTLFMQHNYIPAPYSIYRGIYKLPA